MNLVLNRDPPRPSCTLGMLIVDALVLNTMERPWIVDPEGGIGGAPCISCVPTGAYQLVLHDTAEHPKTFALVNTALGVWHEPGDIPKGVVGRCACLIHPANWASELEGCIGPGLARAFSGGQWMVTDSREAMSWLQATVPWIEGHTLTIQDGQ